MMRNQFPGRRLLLQAIAGMVLVATSRLTFGRASDPDGGDKAGSDKARPGKPESDSKAGKGTSEKPKPDIDDKAAATEKTKTKVLTVVVTGNGKPIRQAEVQVKFPPNAGGQARRPTDEAGEASFKYAGPGTAKVRVIAAGWQSALQEVALKEGSVRLPIKLNSLAEAKQPAGAKPPADITR